MIIKLDEVLLTVLALPTLYALYKMMISVDEEKAQMKKESEVILK